MTMRARTLTIMIPTQGDGDAKSATISTACNTAQANILEIGSPLSSFERSSTQNEAISKHTKSSENIFSMPYQCAENPRHQLAGEFWA